MDQSQSSNTHKVLVKRIGKFSFATLISRILGYARDASVAYVFGGEYLTDTFYTAFRTSNLLRRLLGEGALASSFVPVFSSSLKNDSKEEVQKFLSSIFTALFCILFIITTLGIIFTPQITSMIAPGFKAHPEKFQMTVLLTRWIFPFFLFISLAALVTGVLNSLKHFFLPAAAPAMLSIAEMAYLFLFMRYFPPENQIVGLAIFVVVGGAAHFLVLLPSLFKEKFYLKWRWQWAHPNSIRVARLMIPAVIGLSVDQINAFVDTICATFLVKGSVTALYNSNRLMQLPLALFGISIASVSLSTMSDHTAEKNYDKLAETLNASLRMVIFSVMPASVGLILMARPIVSLLFQHGQFSAFATTLTTQALQGYCIGLIAYSAVKVLANTFYSLQIPNVPVRIAMVCVMINVILNLSLMGPLGVAGLAIATSTASWVNALWLIILIRKHLRENSSDGIRLREEGKTIRTFLMTAFCCAMMTLFVLLFMKAASHLPVAIQVLAGVPASGIVFFLCSAILKMEEQKLIFGMIGLGGKVEESMDETLED